MDIIAIDCCADIISNTARAEDLRQTADLVRTAGARVHTVVADVREFSAMRDGIKSGIDELGDIDVVVASAAVVGMGLTDPFDGRVFGDILDINLRGVWHTMAATVPSMIRNGRGGSVVLVNPMQSALGLNGEDGSAAAFAFAVSKHGIDGLVRSASLAYAGYGIRVNAVEPTGLVRSTVSRASSELVYDAAIDSEVMAENLHPVPPVDPVDVTRAVLFLISDAGRSINGMTLPVHAGFAAR
jgi:NAD(P)-dependent dehydrogenase (short-subunit alcohol dehydrogenase family)